MSEQAAPAKTASGTQASSAIPALASHPIVSRSEWLEARTALLAREKAFTKLRDQLNAEQRALPWVRIEKEYVFDGPSGKITLAQLFNGRSQLFIKHFMMVPVRRGNASDALSKSTTSKACFRISKITISPMQP
jgi:predicted dithiol-disulfide oxidoreductase (DUF899 family)